MSEKTYRKTLKTINVVLEDADGQQDKNYHLVELTSPRRQTWASIIAEQASSMSEDENGQVMIKWKDLKFPIRETFLSLSLAKRTSTTEFLTVDEIRALQLPDEIIEAIYIDSLELSKLRKTEKKEEKDEHGNPKDLSPEKK